MKITAEPRSDQWNADDFIGGPRVFTIAGVRAGTAEQKYDIELVEGEGRVWRPPLTMLRLLIAAWGDEASAWVGRRVKLYRDETVRFGADAVGGIRVAAMSDLPGGKPLRVALTQTRGKKTVHVVELLTEPAPRPRAGQGAGKTLEQQIDEAVTWFTQFGVTREQLEARVGRVAGQWNAQDLTVLRDLGGALNRGEKRVEDEFPQPGGAS